MAASGASAAGAARTGGPSASRSNPAFGTMMNPRDLGENPQVPFHFIMVPPSGFEREPAAERIARERATHGSPSGRRAGREGEGLDSPSLIGQIPPSAISNLNILAEAQGCASAETAKDGHGSCCLGRRPGREREAGAVPFRSEDVEVTGAEPGPFNGLSPTPAAPTGMRSRTARCLPTRPSSPRGSRIP